MTARPSIIPRPIAALLWLVALGYCAFVASELHDGYRAAARGDAPLYTDYTSLYAASMLVRAGPAEDLYLPRQMYRANLASAYAAYGDGISEAQARGTGFAPWMYPPTFILFALPLAYLPYLLSFIAWIAATALPYLAAMRRICGGRDGIALALAAPPTLFNLAYGQTGFLSGGLIALGLTLLRRRPFLAGVLIGLASVKPHLGALVPFALAAGGYWRAFASAAATVAGLAVASAALLGMDPWYGFIGTLLFHLEGFEAGAYKWAAMTSVLSTAHLAGLAPDDAWRVQYGASIATAALVAHAWWRGRRYGGSFGLQAAILCLGTPLAVPMVYLYDLVLVVPGAAWLLVDLRSRGARRGEAWVLAGALGGLIAALWVAKHLGVQLGALSVLALFAVALFRFRDALAGAAPADSRAVSNGIPPKDPPVAAA